MDGFIRDDNVIAMRRKLCNDCASKWDALLEGKIWMFSLCDDCKKKVETAGVITPVLDITKDPIMEKVKAGEKITKEDIENNGGLKLEQKAGYKMV